MHAKDSGVNPRSGVTLAAGSPNVILMRRYVKYTQIGITIYDEYVVE
jgi:hypothetical protein